MADNQENIKQEYNNATIGLNMDQTVNQIKKGTLTYALNAAVENFDSNSINYQNEEGNELCLVFPDELILIGKHFISEKNKHIFFLANPDTGASEIGYMDNNDCVYHTLINAPCLAFDITHPIRKVAHKINNCATEIYWTDGVNPRRYLNIDDIPKLLKTGSDLCDPTYTDQVDCNQLLLQPVFTTPALTVIDVVSGGNLIAGTYQFAIQYADALGNPYTSFQSITNPTPIADPYITTVNFNYPVDKSIIVSASNLDTTGQFQYFNLAVIKTINAISTVELVGTYYIDNSNIQITYTGQNVAAIQLAIQDIFEKFPYYDIAQDVTATQEILVWSDLSSIDRVNYQEIASQIQLQWETWRIPAIENYADELNATNLRSQLRDEVYPYEICFLLANGKQTDSFHIPGRLKNNNENVPDVPDTNDDFIGNPDYTVAGIGYSPYWKIYNTASVTGDSPGHSSDPSYKGPWQYGEMAYWESTEEYPCNESVWGSLAGQKIRHHKFPDVLVSPIIESKIFVDSSLMAMGNDAVFPIGVHVDSTQIALMISTSNLTHAQKAEIIGYKILRGDRGTNKSIVAKGILRNVGKYTKDNQDYYYANYPYNDLADDSFLNARNNAYDDVCTPFTINISALGADGFAEITYTDCNTAKSVKQRYYVIGIQDVQCSLTKPVLNVGTGTITYSNYDVYSVQSRDTGGFCRGWKVQWLDPLDGLQSRWISGYPIFEQLTVSTIPGTKPGCIEGCDHCGIRIYFRESVVTYTSCITNDADSSLPADFDNGRLIFNSPETSFGQPFLGNILKLENVIYGRGIAHFVEVKKNAKYKLITEEAQRQALASADSIGGTDMSAILAAYQAYLTIYLNGMTRQNYAYSFNSVADYNYADSIPNNLGIKQRNLDISRYLVPIVQSVGDDLAINNYERETSVFLKTAGTNLPFPSDQLSINNKVTDHSRFTISEAENCSNPSNIEHINVISYYASLKNDIVNQWGQIYSYETIDTGFERIFTDPSTNNTVFGGDTFISRFGFKTKLPFFLDNRVNAPDDSDVFYDQISNVAYPKYWHSARSITKDYVSAMAGLLPNIISYKAHNFDCPNGDGFLSTLTSTTTSTTSTTQAPGTVVTSNSLMFYSGYFYMFAYGVPYFYCESSYNLDLRQAFNIREGDFYPHVTDDIPDDWVQEYWVPIAQDNTYYYNTTFSKQNKENTFSHIPVDWDKPCYTYFPFRAIYSDVQTADAENRVNAWLTYRALSYFDFPQNYGPLTSVDGIQNRAILARFENKSLLYNNLLVMNTSNPQAAYLGSPDLFKGAPPIDFAETDLGYVGSQHKMLLKIPQGQITVDAKRGQIFLISDAQAIDISAFGSGMNRFFTDHLAFEILRYYPTIDVDNNFTGVGLHGVYDSKYDRVILTKLDYIPLPEYADQIKFDSVTNEFYIEEEVDMEITSTTTTTTTTGCTFNENVTIMYDIIIDAVRTNFSTSFSDANAAACRYIQGGDVNMGGDIDESDNIPLTVGSIITKFGCILRETGYYIHINLDIAWDDMDIIHIVNGIITEIIPYDCSSELVLTFNDINALPFSPTNLVSWNVLFDLPTNGNPFTSVVVNGNNVNLIGGSNITYKNSLFNNLQFNTNILEIHDFVGCSVALLDVCFSSCVNLTTVSLPAVLSAGSQTFGSCTSLTTVDLSSIVSIGQQCFQTCSALTSITFPALTTMGNQCFFFCSNLDTVNAPVLLTMGDANFVFTSLSTLYIPLCTNLGTTVLDNENFDSVTGQTFTLTIPSALMTCNGGLPDGDIIDLQSRNTVTILLNNIKYGALYKLSVTEDIRKITSDDSYIVPSKSDWDILLNYIDIPDINGYFQLAGGKLKEIGEIHWTGNIGATNDYNFNARGGGVRSQFGDFYLFKTGCLIWTTTQSGWQLNYYVDMYNTSSVCRVYGGDGFIESGISIRFVRSASIQELLLVDGTYCTPYVGNNGKVYLTVKIGTQIWLAENINETNYRNGDWITGYDGGVYTPISNANWSITTTEAMCYINDDENNG